MKKVGMLCALLCVHTSNNALSEAEKFAIERGLYALDVQIVFATIKQECKTSFKDLPLKQHGLITAKILALTTVGVLAELALWQLVTGRKPFTYDFWFEKQKMWFTGQEVDGALKTWPSLYVGLVVSDVYNRFERSYQQVKPEVIAQTIDMGFLLDVHNLVGYQTIRVKHDECRLLIRKIGFLKGQIQLILTSLKNIKKYKENPNFDHERSVLDTEIMLLEEIENTLNTQRNSGKNCPKKKHKLVRNK